MKKGMYLILFMIIISLTSCQINNGNKSEPIIDEPVIEEPIEKNFSSMSNREMESAVNYNLYYRPKDGFVGDLIPYYENGIYYLFYLKDQGSSYNHSIYLVETKDFLNYEEKGEVLRSGNFLEQDNWIGTGSICKVNNTYYYFYTGHNEKMALHERIMVAKSENDLYHFRKIEGVYIDPTKEFNTRDFRDPDVSFDLDTNQFMLTITTATVGGKALIVKYNVSLDLKTYSYDKILYEDKEGFWNLECTDTFKINNYWYLSYSGQDDTLWYLKSRSQYNGYGSSIYGEAKRAEGKYFYAPKTVSDGINTYFVGWARRKSSFSDSNNGAWAGNIVVSKVNQNSNGDIYLSRLDNLGDYFRYKEELKNSTLTLSNNDVKEVSKQYESYMLEGDFKYSGLSNFGFVFGLGKAENEIGHINISTKNKKLEYMVKNKTRIDTEVSVDLKPDTFYHFTLVSEGSVIVLYIDGLTCITTRYYGKISYGFGFYSDGCNVEFKNLVLKRKA